MQRFRKRGEIGFCQIGSAIRYTEKQIDEFIEKASKASCSDNDSNSATIGSPSAPVPLIGMQPTSTNVPGKQSAHLLAQAIFNKPN
ncbi:helix-turn-helix domain-containing protein [Sphingobium wenxiniae]|uniref:helix-turn-helix domain-containing protein n=1 Tax=Sphingobium wenxiniae (strain DSM 21828 / CGMCC 1.7748 / JZ-1) TaxID=595605 RepID=UPI0035D6B2AD